MIMDKVIFKGIPTFKISDVAKAKEFYAGYLNFNIDWEHRFSANEPVYMQISRNGLVIHLSENERFKAAIIIFVQTTGIEKFLQELLNKESVFETPPVSLSPWNSKIMEIEDPFGNLIRFNEDLPAVNKT